ncbi:glycosyltransferase [Rubritalea squalenifaciens DSM 18772]|uniref:Glycosyltransferase n=1 Tax=Rubritalea squalenifaciens DSM 18772 TaxID=1123071 RepID=A0A1M6QY96_9BACT|nr:glycosyltransferase family 2 protein [Rubritalea squalenifaciens]SHK25201.1 glycosyltransferase [Rubritalea squalenifaciens DSM 18772]
MKISIITATYNREKTVGEVCESMAAQTYSDLEWVVIDGGSKDATLEVLKQGQRQPDVLVSEPDKGIYDALNKGLKLASGEVIGLLHSDDFYPTEDVLEEVAKAFEDPSVDAVYGDLDYVSSENTDKIVRHWVSGEYDRENFRKGWMPPHPAFYMRRKYYEQLGGFHLKYKIAADYDSMVRYLWKHQLRAVYLPKVLMKMRTGGASNRSLKNILQKSQEDYQVMRENGLGLSTLLRKNLSKIPQFFKRRAS